jgi:hypothetical protein
MNSSPTASALGDIRGIRSSVRPMIVAEVDKQSRHERQMAAVSQPVVSSQPHSIPLCPLVAYFTTLNGRLRMNVETG